MGSIDRIALLIATHNAGKAEEVRVLLQDLPVDLRWLSDIPDTKIADETGTTYVENAVLKASSYARQTGMYSLADDSGLEVDALGGRPGLYSARYAGRDSTYADKIRHLLSELSAAADAQRTARFRCAVAVVDPTGNVLNIGEGICEGAIAREARGNNGFGYDPIFVPRGYSQTFGELPQEEKDQISHRAKALMITKGFLLEFLSQSHGSGNSVF